jgi:hypothetical protein
MNEVERHARRQRRRKRRRNTIIAFAFLSLGMAWFFEFQATTTIIVTRNADASVLGGADPGLMTAGKARSEELARVLSNVDVVSGVDAIFSERLQSSRQTIVPLSMGNEAPTHTISNPEDPEGLVSRILRKYKGKIILVVISAEHIKPLIKEMHGSKNVPKMAADEYDNLYIVTIPWFGKVKTLRLRYGQPYTPAPAPEAE